MLLYHKLSYYNHWEAKNNLLGKLKKYFDVYK